MPATDLTLSAPDGRALAATVFEPDGPTRAAVVMLNATGAPRRFYRHFAGFLATRGLAVLTFDYRGVAGSALERPRRDEATMLDWAHLDARAAFGFAASRWPGVPRWVVGHSFGGQALGLIPEVADLEGAVIVSSGVGDMRRFPWRFRLRHEPGLRWLVPIVVRLFGYVPSWLGLGENLPRGVMSQWRRWCLTRDYIRGALGVANTQYDQVCLPIVHYEITDDDWAPRPATARLQSWYTSAQIEVRRVAPADVNQRRLGHFGFFRRGGEGFWPGVVEFFLA